MTTITSFVLIGTILSYDTFLATVEFQMNPPTNGVPGLAVLPIEAIPCDIKVGKTIYIVKQELQEIPTITCKNTDKTKNESQP